MMTQEMPAAVADGPVPVDELRAVPTFEGLEDAVFDWFAERAALLTFDVGEKVFYPGQSADEMCVLLSGAVQLMLDVGGQPMLYDTFQAGRVVGMLPYSRMEEYTGTGLAVEPVRMVCVSKADFPDMLATSEELGRRLIALMSDRVRQATRVEQQREKLMALGKLSAGLAHELNNPAAAIRSAVDELQERVAALPELVAQMTEHHVTAEQVRRASAVREEVKDLDAPDRLSVLERSAREDDLADRLEDLGVADGFALAGTLADAGFVPSCVDEIAEGLPEEAVPDVLRWVEGGLAADRLLGSVASAAARISALLASVKAYSHMDQAPVKEPLDVTEGVESTLTMLGHKLKKKNVRVERDWPPDLPEVPGMAGELNQVWTNLLDNAIDAVDEGGTIRVGAGVAGSFLTVEVEDDGAGVPEDVCARIFEPFFTTKGVGEGTGLGLDLARRIVMAQHGGTIDVRSEPGRTVFSVRLPLSEAEARRGAADGAEG